MKQHLRKLIVKLSHIVSDAVQVPVADPLSTELNRRAVQSTADYVTKHLNSSLIFSDKKDLYQFAFAFSHIDGSYIELGVYKAESINLIANLASQNSSQKKITIHGFDSFDGLAEDWKGSTGFVKGYFSLSGQLPPVLNNVDLHVGLFSETLPKFVQGNLQPLAFLHVDCDTYESTSQALEILGSKLQRGTVLIFDEYAGYPGWQFGEYLAWQEFVSKEELKYEYLGFCNQTVLIRIL